MIFTDLGSYLGADLEPVLPWEILFRAGVQGAIFKGSQEDLSRYVSTKRSIAHARAAGVKSVGCYYWDDPTVPASVLLEAYLKSIEEEGPDFLAVDIEQRQDWQGNPINPTYLSDHAQELCEGIASAFPNKLLMVYSASYMVYYAPKMADWIDKFEQWTAAWSDAPQQRYRMTLSDIAQGIVRQTHYDSDGRAIRLPDGSYEYHNIYIPEDNNWYSMTYQRLCLMRQYSSRIMLPWEEVGNTKFDHQYDWNYVDMTLSQWVAKTKKIDEEIPTMASIHVETTPQANRAKILHWKPTMALSVPISELDADAVILTAAGMERIVNKQPAIYAEETFKGRQAMLHNAGIPVIARVNIHSGYWTIRQYGANIVLAQTCQGDFSEEKKQESVRQNLVLPAILSSLCDGEFSMDKLFRKELKWLDVKMLDLLMIEMKGYAGQNIGDFWHTTAWNHITKGLNWLMLRGYMPVIPIAMLTTPDWLNQFSEDTEFKNMLSNAKSWLWLHLGQWTQFSSATFPTATQLWTYAPPENFVWMAGTNKSKWSPPDGYGDRVLMHLYAEMQKLTGLAGSEVELNRWQDTTAEMRKFLGFVPVDPGELPIDPEGTMTLAELTTAVKDLQEWRTKIRNS